MPRIFCVGMFAPDHMKFEAERQEEAEDEEWSEPSLAEMVEKSIKILQRSDHGYFLYVEGNITYTSYICVFFY